MILGLKPKLMLSWMSPCYCQRNLRFISCIEPKRKAVLGKKFWTHSKQSFEQIREEKNKLIKTFMLTFLGFLAIFYSFKEKVKLDFNFISIAYALGSSDKSFRNRFNFVADVVDQCGSAVVCIESQINRWDSQVSIPRGSGFIVKEDGLILTNAHVVMHKPRSFLVKLKDGRIYSGQIENINLEVDLATIRINEKNLPVMKLGSSYDLRAGEWVIAIGSPFALDDSVSVGVVSSPQRSSQALGLRSNDMYYIQTDASITFGNSGGPLVNLDGEVVGVNSMKVVTGISFAIPVEFVKKFLETSEKLRKKEGDPNLNVNDKNKGCMGIVMLTLTKNLFDELNHRQHRLPNLMVNKVMIYEVSDNTPAYRSGLQPGDIITEVNGLEVEGVKSIYQALKSGSPLFLKIFRKNEYLYVTVTPELF